MTETGCQDRGARQVLRREAVGAEVDGRPHDDAELIERRCGAGLGASGLQLGDRGGGNGATLLRPGLHPGGLHVGRLRVGGGREHEDALAVRRGLREHPVEGSDALVGDGGHRVRLERRTGRQPGLPVGVDRAADITALHVGDHEQLRGPRRGQHLFERGETGGAVPFEEPDLRFDDARGSRGRLHDAQTELPNARCGVGQAPRREQGRVRIDPDAQATALLDHTRQASAEGLPRRPGGQRAHRAASRTARSAA